jgi:AcrR family transcriptional regulator
MSKFAKRQELDRRVQKTRSALFESLMALMTNRGYRGISVDELLRRARVARSTFYAHFHGKDDLLRKNVARLRAVVACESVGLRPEQRLLRFNRAFYQHAYENRRLYLALLRDPDRGAAVFKKMQAVLADVAASELRKVASGRDPLVVEHAVQFFAGAQWSVLAWWLECRPGLDVDAVHEHFERLAAPVVATLRDG